MRSLQGRLPVPRELRQIPVVNANRSPPIHGMYYSRRSSACIQVMGAEHNVSAVRVRPETQGTSTIARVVHGAYVEFRHMEDSVARSTFVALCCHTANGEKLAAHNSWASKALLTWVVCMGASGGLASLEVLLVCSVLWVYVDARAVEVALRGWRANDQRASENGSPSAVVQRRVEFLAV